MEAVSGDVNQVKVITNIIEQSVKEGFNKMHGKQN